MSPFCLVLVLVLSEAVLLIDVSIAAAALDSNSPSIHLLGLRLARRWWRIEGNTVGWRVQDEPTKYALGSP